MATPTSGIEELLGAFQGGRLSRRQFIQSAAAAGLTLSSISALLAACATSSSPTSNQAKRGGTVTIGVTAPSYSLDPYKSGDSGSRTTFVPLTDYLVRVTPDGVIPQLA